MTVKYFKAGFIEYRLNCCDGLLQPDFEVGLSLVGHVGLGKGFVRARLAVITSFSDATDYARS